MKIDQDSLEMMAVLMGVAFLASVGRELSKDEPRTFWQIVGHVISNTVIGLVAGAVFLFVATPEPLVLVAISAAIGTLGTDTATILIRKYLEARGK